MKKVTFVAMMVAGLVLSGSCGGGHQQQAEDQTDTASVNPSSILDKTIYGVCTEGTAMNTLEMVVDSGDTLTLSIDKAQDAGKVLGGLQVADRVAVVADKRRREALLVINLNTLMGNWVMPDPIDGSDEIGISIKEGGVAESIDQNYIIYRTWKIYNGDLEIMLVRDGGGDMEEETRYEILALGPDTLCYRTIGKPSDETEIFEYNRMKEKPEKDLHGLELEDTSDEFNKI